MPSPSPNMCPVDNIIQIVLVLFLLVFTSPHFVSPALGAATTIVELDDKTFSAAKTLALDPTDVKGVVIRNCIFKESLTIRGTTTSPAFETDFTLQLVGVTAEKTVSIDLNLGTSPPVGSSSFRSVVIEGNTIGGTLRVSNTWSNVNATIIGNRIEQGFLLSEGSLVDSIASMEHNTLISGTSNNRAARLRTYLIREGAHLMWRHNTLHSAATTDVMSFDYKSSISAKGTMSMHNNTLIVATPSRYSFDINVKGGHVLVDSTNRLSGRVQVVHQTPADGFVFHLHGCLNLTSITVDGSDIRGLSFVLDGSHIKEFVRLEAKKTLSDATIHLQNAVIGGATGAASTSLRVAVGTTMRNTSLFFSNVNASVTSCTLLLGTIEATASNISILNSRFSSPFVLESELSDAQILLDHSTFDDVLGFRSGSTRCLSDSNISITNNVFNSHLEFRQCPTWDSQLLVADNLMNASCAGCKQIPFKFQRASGIYRSEVMLVGNVVYGNTATAISMEGTSSVYSGSLVTLQHNTIVAGANGTAYSLDLWVQGGLLHIHGSNVLNGMVQIYFVGTVTPGSVLHFDGVTLERLHIEDGTNNDGMVGVTASVTNSVIRQSLRFGASIKTDCQLNLHNVTFEGSLYANGKATDTNITLTHCRFETYLSLSLELKDALLTLHDTIFLVGVNHVGTISDSVVSIDECRAEETLKFSGAWIRSVGRFTHNSIVTNTSHAVLFTSSPLSAGSRHSWHGNNISSLANSALLYTRLSTVNLQCRIELHRNSLVSNSSVHYGLHLNQNGGTLFMAPTNVIRGNFYVLYKANGADDVLMLHGCPGLVSVIVDTLSAVKLHNNLTISIVDSAIATHLSLINMPTLTASSIKVHNVVMNDGKYLLITVGKTEDSDIALSNVKTTSLGSHSFTFQNLLRSSLSITRSTFANGSTAIQGAFAQSNLLVDGTTFGASVQLAGIGNCLVNSNVTVTHSHFYAGLRFNGCPSTDRSSVLLDHTTFTGHAATLALNWHQHSTTSHDSEVTIRHCRVLGETAAACHISHDSSFSSGATLHIQHTSFSSGAQNAFSTIVGTSGTLLLDATNTFQGGIFLHFTSSVGSEIAIANSHHLSTVTIEITRNTKDMKVAFTNIAAESIQVKRTAAIASYCSDCVFHFDTVTVKTYLTVEMVPKQSTIDVNQIQFHRTSIGTSLDVSCGVTGFISAAPSSTFPPSTRITKCRVDSVLAVHDPWPLLAADKSPSMALSEVVVMDGGRVDLRGLNMRSAAPSFANLQLRPGSTLQISESVFPSGCSLPASTRLEGANLCIVNSTISALSFLHPSVIADTSILFSNVEVSTGLTVSTLVANSTLTVSNSSMGGASTVPLGEHSELIVADDASHFDSLTVGGCTNCATMAVVIFGNDSTRVLGDASVLKNVVAKDTLDTARLDALTSRCPPLPLEAPRPPTATQTLMRTSSIKSSSSQSLSGKTRTYSLQPTVTKNAHTPTVAVLRTPSFTPSTSSQRPPPTVSRVASPTVTFVVASEPTTPSEPPPPLPSATTPVPPTPTPPPPPPPPSRSTKVLVGKALGGSEAAAEAVEASSASAVVVSAALTPTAASQLSRVTAAMQAVNCFMEDGEQSPSYFELPLQPAIGDGNLKRYAGGVVVASAVVATVSFLALFVLRRYVQACWKATAGGAHRQDATSVAERGLVVASTMCSVFLMYFSPNIVGGSVTLYFHGSTPERVCGVGALLLLVVTIGGIVFNLVSRFDATVAGMSPNTKSSTTSSSSDNTISEPTESEDDATTSVTESTESSSAEDAASLAMRRRLLHKSTSKKMKLEFEDEHQGSFFVLAYQTLFDGTEQYDRLVTRLYAIEELVSACAMAAAAGIRPGAGSCFEVTISILVIALVHLFYVAYFHPMRTHLDHFFSLFFAIVQVVMGVACVAATYITEHMTEDGDSSDTALTVVSATVLIIFLGFFAQVFVQAFWAVFVRQRRTHLLLVESEEDERKPPSDNDNDDDDQRRQHRSVSMVSVTTSRSSIEDYYHSDDRQGLEVPLLDIPTQCNDDTPLVSLGDVGDDEEEEEMAQKHNSHAAQQVHQNHSASRRQMQFDLQRSNPLAHRRV